MAQQNDADAVAQIEAEYDYVTQVDSYKDFGHTVNVTVEETGGTGLMINDMQEAGFELQNVDMCYNRFTFKKA